MLHKNQIIENGDITTGQLNLIFRARMLWRDMATWLTLQIIMNYPYRYLNG